MTIVFLESLGRAGVCTDMEQQGSPKDKQEIKRLALTCSFVRLPPATQRQRGVCTSKGKPGQP